MGRIEEVDRQAAIESRIRRIGPALKQLRPTAMLAVLAGAALWPVVAPLLGTGVAAGVAGGAMRLMSGPGQDVITDFLSRTTAADSDRTLDALALQEDFERHLLSGMAGDTQEAAALRAEIGALLRRVNGVDVALAASSGEAREALAGGLAEVGREWREFGWMLAEVRSLLVEVQTRQAESLALQRTQLDLQREQLVKTNLLLRVHERPPATGRFRRDAPVALPAAAATTPPYMGLETFEPEDTHLFFGRERLVAETLARLTETSLLAVVGGSGSGKSSLLRAGVVASLWGGALPGSAEWPVVVMTPGEQPLEQLALRVALLRGIAAASLLDDLSRVPGALGVAADQALLDAPPGARLVLVIDQLEELFTLCRSGAARRRFLDAVLCAVVGEGTRILVLLAIRSDFLGRLGEIEGVPGALAGNTVMVGPMTSDELINAVERPAARVGLELERGLAGLVLRDAGREPGALPLVSHALLETWQRREGSTLTVQGYAEAGGVSGAIERTADRVYESFTSKQRLIARQVLVRLTGIGDGLDGTRRRAAPEELVTGSASAQAVEAVVARLVGARLLTSGDETVEIAHEALIRQWPTLREWLDEDREGLETHRRLSAAAQEWHALAREQEALYRGARLAAASEWAAGHRSELNQVEREFLATSRAAARRELDSARRHARRLQSLSATLAVLLVVAAASATLAIVRSREAETQRNVAEQQAQTATSRRLAAEVAGRMASAPDTARLLSLEAYLVAPTVEARSAMVASLEAAPRLRATLPAGRDAVTAAALAPDGAIVAAGTRDGRIQLWETARAEHAGPPLLQKASVQALAFSHDGSRLVSSGDDGTLRLWDVRRRRSLAARLVGERLGLLDVAFSPDGVHVAAAGSDGSIRLWRADGELRPVGSPGRAHSAPARSVAFDKTGARVVSAGAEDGEVVLWTITARGLGAPIRTGMAGTDAVFGPDEGTLAALTPEGGLSVRNKGSPSSMPATRRGDALALALDDDRATLASAGSDGAIRLWDARTLRSVGPPLRGHAGPVREIAFAQDRDILMSAGQDGTVRLWDADRALPRTVSTAARGSRGLALSDDGRLLAAASRSGTVHISDTRAGQLLARPWRADGGAAVHLSFSPDGEHIAMAGRDASLRVWAVEKPEALSAHRQPLPELASLAVGPGGERLAGGDFASGRLWLWDVAAERPPGVLREGAPATALAFSRSGRKLADGRFDGTIVVWDTTRRVPLLKPLDAGRDQILGLAFSPDERWLASAGADGVVRVFGMNVHGAAIVMPERHPGGARAVAFSADGATLASAGADGSIRLWDITHGRALGGPLPQARADSLAFRDGVLVSAAVDGTVTTWDALLGRRDQAAWRRRICRITGRPLSRREWANHLSDIPYRPACVR